MYMFKLKRGMSPLIATVFLIAFAVALGVMIMNWNPENTEANLQVGNICKKLTISLDNPPCYNEKSLTFSVKNIGQEKIDALKIVSKGKDVDSEQIIKGTTTIATESVTKTIPFLYDTSLEIYIVPLYSDGDDLISCDDKKINFGKLSVCS